MRRAWHMRIMLGDPNGCGGELLDGLCCRRHVEHQHEMAASLSNWSPSMGRWIMSHLMTTVVSTCPSHLDTFARWDGQVRITYIQGPQGNQCGADKPASTGFVEYRSRPM